MSDESLIGRSVVYRPKNGPAEDGEVTSLGADGWVFVRYGSERGGKATRVQDLTLLDGSPLAPLLGSGGAGMTPAPASPIATQEPVRPARKAALMIVAGYPFKTPEAAEQIARDIEEALSASEKRNEELVRENAKAWARSHELDHELAQVGVTICDWPRRYRETDYPLDTVRGLVESLNCVFGVAQSSEALVTSLKAENERLTEERDDYLAAASGLSADVTDFAMRVVTLTETVGRLTTFAEWCVSPAFDSRDLASRARAARSPTEPEAKET